VVHALIVVQEMKIDTTARRIQYLASILALVSSYYAVRASFLLPNFQNLLLDIEGTERPTSISKIILEHPNWFLALVIVTLIATLVSIWKTFRFHEVFYPVCIGFQFFLAERAVASIVDPVVKIMSSMSAQ